MTMIFFCLGGGGVFEGDEIQKKQKKEIEYLRDQYQSCDNIHNQSHNCN